MVSKTFPCALVSVFILSLSQCNAANILFVLPMSSKSMANNFEPIAIALAERHHLTIVGPTKFKIASSNVTQLIPISVDELIADIPNPFETRKQNDLYRIPIPWQLKYCNKLYENTELLNVITNHTVDLIFSNTQYHDCLAGVFHKLQSPIIFIAPLPIPSPMTELFGTYLPSSYIPNFALGDISAQLTFKQRVKNFLYNAYYSVMLDIQTRPRLEQIYKSRLGDPNIPSTREIYKRQVSLIFMNSHFALTNPRPFLPNIVEIGGINCKSPNPLPEDLQQWADEAKDGFIIFSMGSILNLSTMPEYIKDALILTFGKLKERVIWKGDGNEAIPNLPKNVKMVKWLPQQDLLGHPNARLFITHGGILSTMEAVYHGVPVLGMPVFVDQDANMKQAEILGFGLTVEILELNEAKLLPVVRKILDDPRYRQSARERSILFRDQPDTPLEKAVFWTEYVLRHKGAYHLKSAGMDLNFLQYHCIDVVAFLLAITLSIMLLAYYICRLVLRAVYRFLSKYISSTDMHIIGKTLQGKPKNH